MKIINNIKLILVFSLSFNYLESNAQTQQNLKSNFSVVEFPSANEFPLSTDQIYFPPELFPKVDRRINSEDSLKLSSINDLNEWLRAYDSIKPEQVAFVTYI